ncbi:MAG: porin [Pseudomonadota bacterium]
MMKTLLLSTAMVAAGATASVAQGFTGAELGLEFQSFNDLDENTTAYFGGAEFEIVPQFAVAADVSFYSNSASDDNANNFTLHGIYKFGGPRTGVGLFVGQDSIDDGDLDVFGLEGAFDFGQGHIEGFFGSADTEDNSDITFAGLEFEYDLGSGIGVIGGFDRFDLEVGADEFSITTLEIGGSYLVADMVTIFGKIGTIELDAEDIGSDDDSFISIGAEIGFGPDQGLTFSPRSIFSSAPLAF